MDLARQVFFFWVAKGVSYIKQNIRHSLSASEIKHDKINKTKFFMQWAYKT